MLMGSRNIIPEGGNLGSVRRELNVVRTYSGIPHGQAEDEAFL